MNDKLRDTFHIREREHIKLLFKLELGALLHVKSFHVWHRGGKQNEGDTFTL